MSVVANVAINVDSRGATQKLREVQVGAKATEQAFNALTSAAAAFGAGFAISRVIQDVKELDTNLRRLGTVGGDVTALDKGLGQLSKNLGGVASKAELAAASYQALSAGFTETNANLRLVEAATKAAVGGLADTTQVTEVLTKTLNAYGLSGNQAIKVTDSISKAIEYGQVEWADYTSQLGRVASIAAIAGVSIDEVNAFVAAATKNGATAEIAFTGLGATLNSLLQPTKESQEAAAALGISWNIAGLNAKGFDGLIAELAQKMGTNKEAAVRLLGSQEALRGAFAAASKNGQDFSAALTSIQDATGKTDADFTKMQGSLENTLKALDTAFANLSESLGKAFGPTVVIVIQDLTKGINAFAGAMSSVPQPVMNTAGAVAKAVVQVLLLQKALQGILALRLALVGMFAATATGATTAATAASGLSMNMRYLQGSMAATQTQASGLVSVLRSLAAFGVITVGINLIVTGLQEAMAAAAETRRLRGERAAGGAASIFGGTATAEQKAAAQKTLQAVRKEQERYRQAGTIATQTLLGPASQLVGVPTTAQAGARRTVLIERAARAQAVMGLPTRVTGGGLPTPTPTPQTPFAGEDEASKQKKGKTDAERLAEQIAKQKAAAAEALAVEKGRLLVAQTADPLHRQITEAIVRQSDIQREYANKLGEAKSAEETINLQMAERNALQTNALELQRALSQEVDQLTQPLTDLVTASSDRLALENKYQQLLNRGINPELAQEYAQLELAAEKQTELLNLRLAELEAAKAKLSAESEVAKTLDEQISKIKEIIGLQQGQVDKSKKETEEEQRKRTERERKIQEAKDQAELVEQQVAAIGANLGDQLTSVFDNLINKTQDWNDVLRNALMSIGKVLMMAGLNMLAGTDGKGILSFLGFGGGFGSRAVGGPVTSQQPYLIGERGPELFVPNTGGSVVNNRDLRSAMSNGGGSAGGTVLNMSFETTNIGGVEYVSRDQLEAAMASTRRDAARDGAKRGMSMTLDKLQQSPGTRGRVGLR